MELNKFLDHTLLKADATPAQVHQACAEAREYRFAAVCVNPCHARQVRAELEGTGIRTCVVVGFPLGASTSEVKAFETEDAIANGAEEVDMVINVGLLKAGELAAVQQDIEAVVNVAVDRALVKVILECCLLEDAEKVKACELAVAAGADFVKTSTGFGGGGATVTDVRLMRQAVGPDVGVKASGGIRDHETARAMIDAGATRIGASASVAIIEGLQAARD